MGAQYAQFAAHGRRAALAAGWGGGLLRIEQLLQSAVAEAVAQKFTPIGGAEQFLVLGPGA